MEKDTGENRFEALHRRKSHRDLLIEEVGRGMAPTQAEGMARIAGVGPLLPPLELASYDGYKQRRWTLLMAFSWVAFGRNPDNIRNYYPPYRQRKYVWKPSGVGHYPSREEFYGISDAIRMFGDDAYDERAAALQDEGGPGPMASWQRLLAHFANGEIATFAQDYRRPNDGVQPINPDDWHSLVVFPVSQNGTLLQADILGFVKGSPIYTSVLVDREDLFRFYPPRPESEEAAPLARTAAPASSDEPLLTDNGPVEANPQKVAPPVKPRKAGRKDKYPWGQFFDQCKTVWIDNEGKSDEDVSFFDNAAPFEQEMALWCENRPVAQWHGGPGLTQLRKKTGEFLTLKALELSKLKAPAQDQDAP